MLVRLFPFLMLVGMCVYYITHILIWKISKCSILSSIFNLLNPYSESSKYMKSIKNNAPSKLDG